MTADVREDKFCFGTRHIIRKFKKKNQNFFQLSDYEWITFSEYRALYTYFGSALASLGYMPQSKLGIYDDTSLEWNVCAQACFRQNISIVTFYASLNIEGIKYGIELTDLEIILVNATYLNNILTIVDDLSSLKHVIVTSIDPQTREEIKNSRYRKKKLDRYHDNVLLNIANNLIKKGIFVYTYEEFIDIGQSEIHRPYPPSPDDISMIMFTSGTTGMPKGVVLRHRNVVGCIAATFDVIRKDIDVNEDTDCYLSFLPLAHIMTFVVHYCVMVLGIPIGYGRIETLLDNKVKKSKGDFRTLKPTLMVTSPPFFNIIKSEIQKKIRHETKMKQRLFNSALSKRIETLNFLEEMSKVQFGQVPKHRHITGKGKFISNIGDDNFIFKDKDKISTLFKVLPKSLQKKIFNPIKELFGGKLRFAISGGSALSSPTQKFIESCLDIRLLQGYGATETCGPSTLQKYSDFRNTCVGPPIPCVELRLVTTEDDYYSVTDNPFPRGEIWIRGHNVSDEYYGDKEKTSETFTKDGWFITGDVGLKLDDGSLMIIDRVKNLVRPPHGNYVAIEALETMHSNIDWIYQICMYVDKDHNECVALVVPDEDFVCEWIKSNGYYDRDIHEAFVDICKNQDEELINEIMVAISKNEDNNKLPSYEHIHAIFLIPEPWTIENGMLSVVIKKKRNDIIQHYMDDIKELYKQIGYE